MNQKLELERMRAQALLPPHYIYLTADSARVAL